MSTRASCDVVRRAPRPGRLHPALALVAAALAALVPLLGVASPAGAARVTSRAASTATQTAIATSAHAGSTTGSDSRRTARASTSATSTSGRRIEAPRSAADHARNAQTRGTGGHHPTQPATGGLDRTGPPALLATCLTSRQAFNPSARTTPVGAGRSPPSSCGS